MCYGECSLGEGCVILRIVVLEEHGQQVQASQRGVTNVGNLVYLGSLRALRGVIACILYLALCNVGSTLACLLRSHHSEKKAVHHYDSLEHRYAPTSQPVRLCAQYRMPKAAPMDPPTNSHFLRPTSNTHASRSEN